MWRSMLKVAAATGVFGVVHSLLASRTAKQAAARTFGERNRNGLNSGVPFYVPAPEKSGLEVTSAVANLEGTSK